MSGFRALAMLEVGLPRGLLARVGLLSVALVSPDSALWRLAQSDGILCAGPGFASTQELQPLITSVVARAQRKGHIDLHDLSTEEGSSGAEGTVARQQQLLSNTTCQLLLLAEAEGPPTRRNAAILSSACYLGPQDLRLSTWASPTCKMSLAQVLRATWPVTPAWEAKQLLSPAPPGLRRPKHPELLNQTISSSQAADVAHVRAALTSPWWWSTVFVVAWPVCLGVALWWVLTN